MAERPNVLWISTDQQRWDTLGCYGNPYVRTPNLDALGERGVVFEHAYCQAPVCTPSRASFLTGRYPRTTRCRQNGQPIPADEVLVTKILSDAGYTCGLSGKLHISPCQPPVCFGTERRIDDGYDEFHWSHHPAPDWPTNEYIHWLRERSVEYRTPLRDGSTNVWTGMPEEYHQTTWCAQMAINFIEAMAPHEEPWLFSVNLYDPHHPFDPPESYLDRYLSFLDEIPLPPYVEGELDDKPYFQHHPIECQYHFKEMTDDEHRLARAAYWAMIDLIDAQVGRMVAALERTGQLENTIVIFMADHGEMLGDHSIYLKGPYFYEPAVRVPLVVSMPHAIQRGVKCDALVELVDLSQTLLDAAGLDHHPGMQGHSLWPLLVGDVGATHHRDDVYSEYFKALKCHEDPAAYGTMVRSERYKIVRIHGLDEGELYDLQEDPGEVINLWDDEEYTDVKIKMLNRMCDRMAWTMDPLPVRQAWW
jgi:choline-sulfatase